MSVGSVLENVGKDVVKGVEAPFKWIGKAEKVLATAIKDQPELRTTVITLVQKAEAITASGVKDVGEKGLNLQDDAATLALVEDFFSYFQQTLVPIVEKVYAEVKTDVASPVAPISAAGPFA